MSLARPITTVLAATLGLLGGTAPQDEEGLSWPREFTHEGYLVVVYQPQLETFEGDNLTGRTAVSVVPPGQSEPVFGAVWFDAIVETDREERTVEIGDVTIPRVRFPDASEEQTQALADVLSEQATAWEAVASLDHILTSLEMVERERAVSDDINTEPPDIRVTYVPSILVTLDGEPVLHDIENTDLQAVVNTPFTIIYYPSTAIYYLYAGQDAWFYATDMMGSWAVTDRVPEKVTSLVPPDTAQVAVDEADETGLDLDINDVTVVVVTEPTELIVTEGPPEYASIDGTDLLYVSNSESDVFVEINSQQYFIVLAGRWYTSGNLDGPWSFIASDSIPADFAKIPPESARGSVLSYVAGTDQAKDAVLDNSIPQTSAIRRDATLEVTYDGDPQFEPIEGTEMTYAVNTASQVIEVDGRYYACDQAVWYESDGPTGPYTVATEMPDDIQDIPPDNPNYNVKYVYVYDYTPEVAYVGYTPGYTGSYVYGSTVVYGTGWVYRPWISPFFFYPRPMTWGFHVRFNPWWGWSVGFGFRSGPFHFGFAMGPMMWRRPMGWWGPRGFHRGFNRGFHRGYGAGFHAGYRAGQRSAARQNIYRNQRNASRNVDRATARNQMSQRQGNRGGQARDMSRTQGGQRSQGAERLQPSQGRNNNLYADRNGDVYRRNSDGSWQMRDNQNWGSADRSGTQNRQRDANRQQPSRDRAQPSTQNRSQNLNREYNSRQRGTQRTQSYNRQRSGGGGSRGGGRRR